MAVRLVSGVKQLIDKGAGQFMQEVVATERSLAPIDTGNLAGSITGRKVKLGSYVITTNAVGRNGFAYPLHIEFGQGGYSAKGMHFVTHGREVITKSTAPSKQSHFARKTISKYGGIYTGK